MKQTTIQFDKKKNKALTLERLQEAVDLIAKTNNATESMKQLNLGRSLSQHLVKAKILERVSAHRVEVIKPILERKDFYKVMDFKYKHNKKLRDKKNKSITSYNQLPKADTDMLGLVNMPSTEPIKLQRTPKPRVKKAVALPWWKRFLLYLLNH
jgi:hypothetical protein